MRMLAIVIKNQTNNVKKMMRVIPLAEKLSARRTDDFGKNTY